MIDAARRIQASMRGKAGIALASLVLAAASGCARAAPATAPAPVDRGGAVRAIALCTTTEAQLRAALGEPTRDGLFRRERILSWIIDEDDVVRYLAVMLDARGVVVDLVWDIPTEIPWTPANQCAAAGRGTS